MIMSDERSNGPQFSKIIVVIVLLMAIIGIGGIVALSMFFTIEESIVIAMISALGTIAATTLVWFLKKSQVENNTKIYMAAYKEIAMFKIENGEGEEALEMLDEVGDKMIDKMDSSINEAIDEGSSLIDEVNLNM